MNFSEFIEEWKPFPKDKVERQIEKKKKGDASSQHDAHAMKAVKNFRTKVTDPDKATEKHSGDERHTTWNKMLKHDKDANKEHDKHWEHGDKAQAASDAGDKKKASEHAEKMHKHRDKHIEGKKRTRGMMAVDDTVQGGKGKYGHKGDLKKQAQVNKLEKAFKKPANQVDKDKAGLERAFGKSSAIRESMNFTEFLDATVPPLYEAEGDLPRCPPGYKFDKNQMMCVPKANKDKVGQGQVAKDSDPKNSPPFNVWGRSGMNGDGYAWEEKPTGQTADGAIR